MVWDVPSTKEFCKTVILTHNSMILKKEEWKGNRKKKKILWCSAHAPLYHLQDSMQLNTCFPYIYKLILKEMLIPLASKCKCERSGDPLGIAQETIFWKYVEIIYSQAWSSPRLWDSCASITGLTIYVFRLVALGFFLCPHCIFKEQ